MTPRFFLMIPEQLNGYDLIASRTLSSTDKLVFEEIFTILNQHRSFFMSNNTLAKRLGVSSSSIKHSIKHLKDQHLISTSMKTKGHLIKGRIISLWGGSNKNHGGSHMNGGGSYMNEGGSHMNPNISSNISTNRSSRPRSKNPTPESKNVSRDTADNHLMIIKQKMAFDFRYYKSATHMDYLVSDAKKLLKKYPFNIVVQGIKVTNIYQSKGNFINYPRNYIDVVCKKIMRKSSKSDDGFVDSTNVDMNKRAEQQTKRAKERLLKKEGKLK